MDRLIGVIFLVSLGTALAASSYPKSLQRSFRCYPAKHIELQWKRHLPAFHCRLDKEEFVIVSSDLAKYANNVFDINVKSHATIKASPILRKPMSNDVEKVIPVEPSSSSLLSRLARSIKYGYGGSSSSAHYGQYHEHHHEQSHGSYGQGHYGQGSGMGVGAGMGVGVGVGMGGGFGGGIGSGGGGGGGGGSGGGFGSGGGSGGGFGIGGGFGSGFGIG